MPYASPWTAVIATSGSPQLTLSVTPDSSHNTFAFVTEGATPGGGSGVYTYAWTLERDDGTDGSSLLSDPTAQAPTWTPDRNGWWEVRCTVTSDTATTLASRRVSVITHIQTYTPVRETLVAVPS